MSENYGYDNVVVLSADTMTELADMETRLVAQYVPAGLSVEALPAAKHVRVYRVRSA